MCTTGFVQLNYFTELPIPTCKSLVCRHLLGICHIIVTHQLTKYAIFCDYAQSKEIIILLNLDRGSCLLSDIAERYGLDGPGIETREFRNFHTPLERIWSHATSYTMITGL